MGDSETALAQEDSRALEPAEESAKRRTHLRSNSFTEWSEELPPELTSSSNQERPGHQSSILGSTFIAMDSRVDPVREPAGPDREAAEGRDKHTSRDPTGPPRERFRQSEETWRIPYFIKKRLNFYRLHFLYFVLLMTFGTTVLYVSPKRRPSGRIPFIDALFNATSASCVVGLNSIDLQEFSESDQVVMMFLIMAGGHIFTSLLPVLVRRYYFHMYIRKYTRREQPLSGHPSRANLTQLQPHPLIRITEGVPLSASKLNMESLAVQSGGPAAEPRGGLQEPSHGYEHVRQIDDVNDLFGHDPSHDASGHERTEEDRQTSEGTRTAGRGLGGGAEPGLHSVTDSFYHSHTWAGETAKVQAQRFKLAYELWRRQKQMQYRQHSIDLQQKTDEQRSEDGTKATEDDGFIDPSKLRTQEYKALQALSWLVPAYLIVTQVLAFVIIHLNFLGSPRQQAILDEADVPMTFFSAFQSVSGLQNAGLVLLSTSLAEFKTAVLLLLTVGSLILLGNTMYAPTMRGIIYLLYRVAGEKHKSTFKYLLDHPRKCYTHLFPWNVTKWLVVTVIAFNATELFFFCLLDWNTDALKGLSANYKLLLGLFQSLNTRSAGFLVLNLGELSPAMLVLYIVMMYVAVYPVYLSRQTSRERREVYDELDIGIFEQDPIDTKILTQSRKLLLKDSALVFFGLFVICIIQSHEIQNDPNFSIFNLMFEVVSAYGNVGLSMGYSCVPTSPEESCISPTYSLVGAFKPLAKLVLVFLMLLGRHRGLPDNIDAAVTIPARKTFRQGRRRSIQVDALDPVELIRLAEMDTMQHTPRKSREWGPSHSPTSLFERFREYVLRQPWGGQAHLTMLEGSGGAERLSEGPNRNRLPSWDRLHLGRWPDRCLAGA